MVRSSNLRWVTKKTLVRVFLLAGVVKLADALDSKSCGLTLRDGSSPSTGTNEKQPSFLEEEGCFFVWQSQFIEALTDKKQIAFRVETQRLL